MIKVIDKSHVMDWLEKLTAYWKNKDVDGAVNMFASCSLYQESPFLDMGTDIKDIRRLWSEINEQDSLELKYQVVCIKDYTAVINYDARYGVRGSNYHSNGIYVITFDSTGNCSCFKQWFMIDNNL